MRTSPRTPSWFAPVSTSPAHRAPYASAADSNKTSIDGRLKLTGSSTDSSNVPPGSTSA